MALLVKSLNGLAYASIKSRNGLVVASIKSIRGLDATAGSPTPEILWWKLNDGSGTAVAAAVGEAGTTDADWITGKSGSGNALDFNGSSDQIQSNAAVNYGGASKITVCLWAYLDSTSATQVLFESSTNISTARTFLAYISSAGRVVIAHTDPNGLQRVRSCAAPATGAWVHLAFVYSPNASPYILRIFYDGVEQSTTLDANDFATATTFATYTLNIGMRNASTFPFDGRIDDIRIYNTELLAAAVVVVRDDPQ